ncbi:UNVERIFIED_CONTAM: hypothetical protein RMT77_002970 [Armadillidium vulgare]
MNEEVFEQLLSMVCPLIEKRDTRMRTAISPSERLSLTLRFLASGNSFVDLKFSSYIAPTTISEIVMETCEALCTCLKDYIKLPRNHAEWESVAHQFSERWTFPHCVGAMDGKHVEIAKPHSTGSFYYNYKGSFSVVLLAVVNANYEFLMADCGINGRVSDGGVLGFTHFGEKLLNNSLHLPDDTNLPHFQRSAPYVFVGDDAFPLSPNIMKPYPGTGITQEQRIFNYRCSRAWRISENVFGIMSPRFRIFRAPIQLAPEKVRRIVLACCYLHNFLRHQANTYMPADSVDQEVVETGQSVAGSWRPKNIRYIPLENNRGVRNPTTRAKTVRDTFTEYFNGPGAVDWTGRSIGIVS